jgi:glycosyltransferase involved in cell wall biosynthesis
MISIIIPTFNEEHYLPKTLKSIEVQDFDDYEVIVADNHSNDHTAEIARAFGARVVAGGLPSAARNRGAEAAQGEYLLFMDSDITIPERFLTNLWARFERDFIDICIPARKPADSTRQVYKTLFDLSNRYFKVMAKIKPVGLGNCILVTRRLHRRIGGFDERIRFGEDYDYINRAARVGRFKVYLNIPFYTSVRRVEVEGIRASIVKSFTSDIFFIFTGKPNEKAIHEFGQFTKADLEHIPHTRRKRRPRKKAARRIKKRMAKKAETKNRSSGSTGVKSGPPGRARRKDRSPG